MLKLNVRNPIYQNRPDCYAATEYVITCLIDFSPRKLATVKPMKSSMKVLRKCVKTTVAARYGKIRHCWSW